MPKKQQKKMSQRRSQTWRNTDGRFVEVLDKDEFTPVDVIRMFVNAKPPYSGDELIVSVQEFYFQASGERPTREEVLETLAKVLDS